MGIFSSSRVIMKTFAAALFAAGVSAVTGVTGTAMTASKVSTTTAVVSNKLTQKQEQSVTATALATADHYIGSVLCTTHETNKFVCSLCEVVYVDGTNFKGAFSAWANTQAVVLPGATTELKSMTNMSANGSRTESTSTAYGSAASVTTSATGWSAVKVTGKTTQLDCEALFTDSTDNTTDREKVVKDGMATAQQGISHKAGSTETVLKTAVMVTGTLSTVATVGAAIAALSMSF